MPDGYSSRVIRFDVPMTYQIILIGKPYPIILDSLYFLVIRALSVFGYYFISRLPGLDLAIVSFSSCRLATSLYSDR